ncbi:MAG TPA: hypothetical protein VFS60_01060 [Thermoanaerobaculia bacterium]|nr:hypothetical protein [Thermoanaerobaculia bacterium]
MSTKRWLVGAVLSVGLSWTAGARAYDLVKVLSGSEILVNQDGRQLSLIVSGIAVPAPPSAGSMGEYRGTEARDFLVEVLRAQDAYIKELQPLRPDSKTVRVRIRIGAEGERDLAVLMAEAGLGVVDKVPHEDPEFLAAVRDGERAARVAHRGMHDGGYQAFMSGNGKMIDFGVGTLSGDKPTYRAYLDNLAKGGSSSSSSTRRADIHSSGTAAIHDWGSKMGLPPDSSASGH